MMDYNTLASVEAVTTTVNSLKAKGYETFVVDSETQALAKIKDLIPQGVSVMNGSSVTLEQIGYTKYLKSGKHAWIDLHAKVNAEADKTKRSVLRKQSVLSDYYIGSVHALIQNGEFLIASNTGSQLPHVVYSSPNLIFVVGTQKIVSNNIEAMKRLQEYVVPLEEKHMQQKYGVGTKLNKLLIFKGESPYNGRKIRLILVNKVLGF